MVLGALLWRAGVLTVVVAGSYESARLALRFVDVPAQVELGLGLLISGFGLVMASLLVERIRDYQAESDLSE
jgi:hypothetical protein